MVRFLSSSCLALVATLLSFSFISPVATAASGNLLTNPGAETNDFTGWTTNNILVSCGDGSDILTGWCIGSEAYSGNYGFVSSYPLSDPWATMSQEISLADAGYSERNLDDEPDITVRTFVSAINENGASPNDAFRVYVELRDENHDAVAIFDTGTQSLAATDGWEEIAHTFSGYGNGVRYVYFEQMGKNNGAWSGAYGAAFDDASVVVEADPSEEPRAAISSWETSMITDNTKCPQKLKVKVKGKRFDNDAEVTLGGHTATNVDVRSSKELVAKFCLDKFSKSPESIKKTLSVKNPGTKKMEAKKRVDLTVPQLLSAPTTSFNQDTKEGIINIQKVLVSQKLLSKEDIVGVYGPKTMGAVKAFQAMHGIPQTGNVGPKTITAFRGILK